MHTQVLQSVSLLKKRHRTEKPESEVIELSADGGIMTTRRGENRDEMS